MSTIREIKYAFRSFFRNPGFAAVAILTLALGVGANTAIFSFVNAILLRPAPFRDMDRLIRIESVRGSDEGRLSMLEIHDIRDQIPAIENIAAYRPGGQFNASGSGRPEEIPATSTTGNLFEVLGVPFHIGGTWPKEYDLERNFGIILNYELWKRRFGSDPKVIGSKITLDAAPFYTVFGVVAPGIRFPDDAVMFRSICTREFLPSYKNRDARFSFGLARLKPGVTYQEAASQLKNLSKRLAKEYPDTNAGLEIKFTPLRELYVGNIRPYLLVLFGVVCFVLLIACANVVNLLLSRALAREKDIAIRSSLGAGRWHLIRQILIESMLLAFIGGGLGILLATIGVRLISRMIQIDLPPWMTVNLDYQVLLFTLGITIFSGLGAGLAPALQSSRADLNELLKEGTRGSSLGSRRHLLRRILVAAEIALAMILLVGAGLMIRTFFSLQNTSLGFNPENITTLRFALSWRTYASLKETEPFVTRLLERARALPGVEGAEAITNPPLAAETETGKLAFTIEGQSIAEQQRNPFINDIQITPGYFRLMGIPLLQGRFFERSDHKDAPRVGIISKRFEERMWPGQSALGKRLKIGGPDSEAQWTTIVGVVGNVKHDDVTGEDGLELYGSYQQVSTPNMFVMVKSRLEPSKIADQVTRIVWDIDADQSTFDAQTMEQRIAATLWQRRVSGTLMILFAALALLLAAVGIYGVMSYSVTQRTREIGIRLALGALGSDVRKMVLSEVLILTIVGGIAGLLGSFVLTRFIQTLFYRVSPSDPLTYFLVPLFLIVIALAAGFLPALRASRVDPIEALRYE